MTILSHKTIVTNLRIKINLCGCYAYIQDTRL